MASPFPGMDPYLESPTFWPDFHDALCAEIRGHLNQNLPQPYYAQLGVREQICVVDDERSRSIVPDVTVQRHPWTASGGGVAVLDRPRAELSEAFELLLDHDELSDEVSFVEIRNARSNHEVVTVIEILSPSNKAPGSDRDLYTAKRSSVLASTTSLIEIDLLRAGDRSVFGPKLSENFTESRASPTDYLVLVHCGWRARHLSGQVYPIELRQVLPVIGVPLSESEALAPLDLQFAFQEAYDRGPYRRGAVNYDALPESPLPAGLDSWAKDCIARRRGHAVS